MGTDWRNSDPEVEPMVEVYQGARQNYEYPGCPRCPTENDAIGGWEPAGFICNALLKGVKFSFESSSDHGSTHISYAMVYAENASREAIHAAMKLRHTYGATDNIIADTRCKAADGTLKMMGDEFSVKGAPTIEIKLIGTRSLRQGHARQRQRRSAADRHRQGRLHRELDGSEARNRQVELLLRARRADKRRTGLGLAHVDQEWSRLATALMLLGVGTIASAHPQT